MTNEELCLRYRAGDEDAGNELIENNMPFIRSIVYGLYNDNHQKKVSDEEDYIQIASMALIRAADRFDPSRGLKFLTYAGKAIRHAILDTIDAEARMSTEYKEGSADAESTEEKKSDDGPVSMNTIHLRTHCLLPGTYETNPEIIYLRKETLEELHDSMAHFLRARGSGSQLAMALMVKMNPAHWQKCAAGTISPQFRRRKRT